MAGAPPLVRMVDASIGETLAGMSAGVVADVLVLSTVDDLGLSGARGWLQIGACVLMVVVWAVGSLVQRPRLRREFAQAVALTAMPDLEEETRLLRKGRVRVAVFAVVVTPAGAYLFHFPLLGVGIHLVLLMAAENTWSTARQWERLHGVHLWKPALAAVGAERARRSPYYVTPAGVLTP